MKLFILLCLLFVTNAFSVEIIGKAYIKDKLIYIENHDATIDSRGIYQYLETKYSYPDAKMFAEIKSNFKNNINVPDVDFQDSRTKLIETIRFDANKNIINISREIKGKKDNKTLELFTNSILGQGFHNFIIGHLELIKIKKTEVNFIISSKADQYHFFVEVEKIENGKIYLKIVPSNLLIRAFVKPIKLVYEEKTKYLLSFEGLSNLDDENGNSWNVRIEYSYPKS